MNPAVTDSWHRKLLQRSLLKREKLKEIQSLLRVKPTDCCLDLGGDNGILSAELRQGPGRWVSADMAEEAVLSCHELCGRNAVRIDGTALPFRSESLDWIVVIDLLEHVHEDTLLAKELSRILKPDGYLLVHVPRKAGGLLRWLAPKLGYTDQLHGHVRQGYTIDELTRLFQDEAVLTASRGYSRFFTQAIDLGIHAFMALKGTASTSKGHLVTSETLHASGTAYRVYGAVFPLLRGISSMDRFLFFASGHNLLALFRKRA